MSKFVKTFWDTEQISSLSVQTTNSLLSASVKGSETNIKSLRITFLYKIDLLKFDFSTWLRNNDQYNVIWKAVFTILSEVFNTRIHVSLSLRLLAVITTWLLVVTTDTQTWKPSKSCEHGNVIQTERELWAVNWLRSIYSMLSLEKIIHRRNGSHTQKIIQHDRNLYNKEKAALSVRNAIHRQKQNDRLTKHSSFFDYLLLNLKIVLFLATVIILANKRTTLKRFK